MKSVGILFLDEVGGQVPGDKPGVRYQCIQKTNIVGYPPNIVFIECALHARYGFRPGIYRK